MNTDLKVYWRPGCSSCVKVKEFLAQLGVKSVPVVARGRDYVFAQALEDVSRFVGREFSPERLPPQALVEKWLGVLRATQRHVLQLPPARLHERAVQSRDRSIRDLAYHVYQVPDAFLQAVEDGVEDLTAVYNAAPPPGVTNTAQIAAYGKAITEKVERWWAELPDKSCRRTVKTYYGERPLHELLERCTWHSAQHARQIVAVLERLGIEPDGSLTAADYAGLPMPKGLWE